MLATRRDDTTSRQRILSDLEVALNQVVEPDDSSTFNDGRYLLQRLECGCIDIALVIGRLRRGCTDAEHDAN
jgi:hypothetical protein